ncbi:MAG TPA: cellulose-binding domain-containing protein [Micromonosporaceae bacterium]|nr:cellulose-binding domain-containing protein [Micromonosporaceae bacterium]
MKRRYALAVAGLVGVASTAAAVAVHARAATGCQVSYAATNEWTGGWQGGVVVRNLGDPVTRWDVAFDFADGGQRVTQSWNSTFAQSGQRVTFSNAQWNGSVPSNGSTSFGFLGTFTGANPAPGAFSINGVLCTGPGVKGSAQTDSPGTPGATPSVAPTSATPSVAPTSATPSAEPVSATPTPATTTASNGSVGTAPTRFTTLAPGAALPSGAQCATWVLATPIAENKGMNAVANRTTGRPVPGATGFTARVDGNFTGTTGQILRWAACKWGLDEDMVRAQAAVESWWRMNTHGDWTTDASRCAPGHPLGADGRPGSCPESFGIMQIRYPYNVAAFPYAATSSAFNVDHAFASWRSCFEGRLTWLNTVDRGAEYTAGDAWGCMGVWFAGRWRTAAADAYVVKVKDHLAQRIWETRNYQQP